MAALGKGGGDFFALYRNEEILKKIFSETPGPILKSFHRSVPWVTFFKTCLRNFDMLENMGKGGGGGGGLFALHGHEEILKKSPSLKPLV